MAGVWWALHSRGIRYSSDDGATWSDELHPTGDSDDIEGIYGPTGLFKIYCTTETLGVHSYDGTSWTLEDSFSDTYPYGSRDPRFSVFCAADDSLVVTTGQGAFPPQTIRTGSAGGWGPEYTAAANEIMYHCHGKSDGTVVYAVSQKTNGGGNTQAVLLKRDSATGIWSESTNLGDPDGGGGYSFLKVHVLSSTDIRIMGRTPTNEIIWKWDGASTLSTQLSIAVSEGYPVFRGFWIQSDNSDGWMASETASDMDMYRWNGSSWTKTSDIDPGNNVMHNVSMDSSDNAMVIGRADTSYWDGSWTDITMSPTNSDTHYDLVWLDQTAPIIVPALVECPFETIGGDFVLNHYKCLVEQHEDLNSGRIYHVPFALGNRGQIYRKLTSPNSSSLG